MYFYVRLDGSVTKINHCKLQKHNELRTHSLLLWIYFSLDSINTPSDRWKKRKNPGKVLKREWGEEKRQPQINQRL